MSGYPSSTNLRLDRKKASSLSFCYWKAAEGSAAS